MHHLFFINNNSTASSYPADPNLYTLCFETLSSIDVHRGRKLVGSVTFIFQQHENGKKRVLKKEREEENSESAINCRLLVNNITLFCEINIIFCRILSL